MGCGRSESMVIERFMNRKKCLKWMAVPLMAALWGCGSGVDDNFMTAYLEQYHEQGVAEQDSFRNGYSVYFDLSDGMNYAYQDETLRCYLEAITNKVDGEWNSYGLGNSRINALNLTKKDLFNRIVNVEYKDIMAPIEASFKQIVSERKLALLISDLEEYEQQEAGCPYLRPMIVNSGKKGVSYGEPKGGPVCSGSGAKIQYSAYASQYFTQWLRTGGQIYFYVMDYKEPINKTEMKDKHLYFVLFDDAKGTLREKVDQALVGRPVAYRNFLLTSRSYSLETKYASATQGGNYHDGKGEDLVSVVNESDPSVAMYINRSTEGWEFYPCNAAWGEIKKNADAMREEGVPRADRFKHFLSKLFLKVLNEDSYTIKDLRIRVTNVQEDFAAYAHYQKALTCPPKVITEEGEKIVDMCGNKYTELYYDPVTGELKPEYRYAEPRATREVKDMFEMQLIPVEGDASQKEIAIDFSNKFNGENMDVSAGDLLKIELVIGECDINYDKMKDYFIWKDVARTNSSIAESLRNTLQAEGVSPSGRVIYTYYIKAY